MDNYLDDEIINIGFGEDQTFLELAGIIKNVSGYNGELIFDPTRPDGTPRKILDSSKIFTLGWNPKISLKEGINIVYKWYKNNNL